MNYIVILNNGTQCSSCDLEHAQWFLKNAMNCDSRVTGKIYRLVEV